MKKFAKITIVIAFALITALTAFGCTLFSKNDINSIPNSVESAKGVVFNSQVTERQEMNKLDAIEKVARSVVAIKVPTADGKGVSYGSGVIVDVTRTNAKNQNLDGENVFYIFTCHHVIEDKGAITVFVPDEEGDNFGESDYNDDFTFNGVIGSGTFNGQVSLVGGDMNSDIAVLKLDITGSGVTSDKIVKSSLAPSTGYRMRVGEDVFAIGNPSGILPGSVTVGTIGYINREVTITGIGDMTLVQLNVDIYHGSSGGALFNMYGEVIGITNSGSDTYVGIGYAVPYVIDTANGTKDNGFINIASQLLGTYIPGRNFGYITGRLEKFGFSAQSVTDQNNAICVADITAGSQAYSSGMQVGDVIDSVQVLKSDGNGSYIAGSVVKADTLDKISSVISTMNLGDKLAVNLIRTSYTGQKTNHIATFTARQYIFCDTGIY